MNRDLLMAILDTLLPGDDGGAAGAAPLPRGSGAGLDLASLELAAQPILDGIDPAQFEQATAAERVAALRNVEQAVPDAYRDFLGLALAAYYQAPAVLAALSWRSLPPQPLGHRLVGDDDPALQLLEKVRRRGTLWRA